MKFAALGMLVLAISGCAVYTPPPAPVAFEPAALVTREEAEAKSARTQCRALAKNLLQVARCDGR